MLRKKNNVLTCDFESNNVVGVDVDNIFNMLLRKFCTDSCDIVSLPMGYVQTYAGLS